MLVDIGIISSGAKYAAAIIPFFLLILYVIQHLYLRTSRQLRLLEIEARAPLYTLFIEATTGIQHIRAYGWQAKYTKQHFELLDYSQKPYYYLFCVQRWLNLVLGLCTWAIAAILVTMSLVFPHSTSESAVGLSLLNLITFSSGLAYTIESWVNVETSLGGIARVRTFCLETPQEPIDESEGLEMPQSWPRLGTIEFDSVDASYKYAPCTCFCTTDTNFVEIVPMT